MLSVVEGASVAPAELRQLPLRRFIAQSTPKLRAWIVRPVSALDGTLDTAKFTLVARMGEITRPNGTGYVEFANLSIPVKAGDLLALHGINSGLAYGSGTGK